MQMTSPIPPPKARIRRMNFTLALRDHILIFTDGACSGNPGPGGWGSIVVTPEGQVTEIGGQGTDTTNNRMELAATIHALKLINQDLRPVLLFTDSTYIIRGITQWIWGWRQKGWKNAAGQAVLNRDLWEELDRVLKDRPKASVNWQYCRGHRGVPGNERCDEIAVKMSQRQWVDLYTGPLLNYSVAIHDLPEFEALPEMRPKEEKKVAYSYLSYVDGQVIRHRDWPSCERRVKGKAGAKFKKAMAAAEEGEILQGWGLKPTTSIADG